MNIADLSKIEGRRFPAGRRSKNLVGGLSNIQAKSFCLGQVSVDAGGQIPWHNHVQEEVYILLSGSGEMCVGEEKQTLVSGQAVYIPTEVFHQLTNTGSDPLTLIYCYGPAGDVAHWRKELEGTLPRAGIDAPTLPEGATPQRA